MRDDFAVAPLNPLSIEPLVVANRARMPRDLADLT